jgi:hypothetical protein
VHACVGAVDDIEPRSSTSTLLVWMARRLAASVKGSFAACPAGVSSTTVLAFIAGM